MGTLSLPFLGGKVVQNVVKKIYQYLLSKFHKLLFYYQSGF
jgi:hypothetical protein